MKKFLAGALAAVLLLGTIPQKDIVYAEETTEDEEKSKEQGEEKQEETQKKEFILKLGQKVSGILESKGDRHIYRLSLTGAAADYEIALVNTRKDGREFGLSMLEDNSEEILWKLSIPKGRDSISDKVNLAGGTTYCFVLEGQEDEIAYELQVNKKEEPVQIKVPSGLKGNTTGLTENKISWKNVKDSSGYEIAYSKSRNGSYTVKDVKTKISYTHSGLKSGTAYYYKVRAYKSINKKKHYSSYSSVISVKTAVKPGQVKSVKAKSAAYNKISITWKKPGGAEGYQVSRSAKKKTGFKTVKTITKKNMLTFKDSKLKSGTLYYYRIRAYKTVNGKKICGSWSSAVKVKPVPVKPSGIKVKWTDSSGARVSWKKVAGASGYEIRRSVKKSSGFKKAADVKSSNRTSYTNRGLDRSKTHYYKVRAYRVVNGKKIYSPYSGPKKLNKVKLANKKLAALTFDDGPDAYLTPKLLKVLKKHNTKATFYVLGSKAKSSPKVLKQITKDGHQIGSHTTNHRQLTSLSSSERKKEINNTVSIIKKITGKKPSTMRPPYGAYNSAVLKDAKAPVILWSVDTWDWKYKNSDTVYKNAVKNTRDGAIVLMHDIHPTTVQAVSKIIVKLKSQGYTLVTVDELIKARGKAVNGRVYREMPRKK